MKNVHSFDIKKSIRKINLSVKTIKKTIIKKQTHQSKIASFTAFTKTHVNLLKIPSICDTLLKTSNSSISSLQSKRKQNIKKDPIVIPFSQVQTNANDNTISSFLNSHLGDNSKIEEDETSKDFFLTKINQIIQNTKISEYEIEISKMSFSKAIFDSTIYNSNSIYSNEISELKEKDKPKRIQNLKINKNMFSWK